MQPRVLMIISFFYPHIGGAEQQALQLAEQLARRGVPVSVLTRKFKGLASHEVVRGVPVYREISTLPWGKWFALSYLLSVCWFLYKKRHSYDIIHCHILQGFHSIAALVFKKLFGKKVIIKVAICGFINDFICLKNSTFGTYCLRKLHHIDRLITLCSRSTSEALQEGFTPDMILQLPNGVDIAQFTPLPDAAKSGNNITFIGRLVNWKGVHVLLEAFEKLTTEGIQAHLEIIGDGPEMHHLKTLAHQLGIDGAVTFHGAQQEVITWLQHTTVFTLPSFTEGLPNALLEAMACGLPVVATRVGGITDLIQDGINGILIEPENSRQLYQALKKILQDEVLAKNLGAQARKTVEERFSLESVAGQYVSLYQTLVPATNR